MRARRSRHGERPAAGPVSVDPDATPLPAPDSVGSTTRASGGVTTTVRAPAPAPAALVWPVPAGSISQYYHAGHLALDIAAAYGSQVVAAQAGVVTSSGWRNNGGGYVISIDHGNGMITVYNHLGSLWVSAGQYVSAGQGIGGVGCTGHVHRAARSLRGDREQRHRQPAAIPVASRGHVQPPSRPRRPYAPT